jgi:hypothetical protein
MRDSSVLLNDESRQYFRINEVSLGASGIAFVLLTAILCLLVSTVRTDFHFDIFDFTMSTLDLLWL